MAAPPRPSTVLLAACLLLAAAAAVTARPPRCDPGCGFGAEGKLLRNGTLVCRPCLPGWYTPAAGDCCRGPCRGIITVTGSGATATAACTPCPRGALPTIDRTTNTTICLCGKGSQATGVDAATGSVTGCMLCPPGTFNANLTASTTACVPCINGTAVPPGNGSFACIPCGNNSLPLPPSGIGCGCPEDYYMLLPRPPRRSSLRLRHLMTPGGGDALEELKRFKPFSCAPCNTTASYSNPPYNGWPTCCLDGTAWNFTAKACV